ncbi:hypothetical protein HOP50_15g75820 [Chloropicon primus]|uniref:Uncharacterized protein n=2 Tax=Chloropicon primus TaxID=1764295 RepID=A0A5B8MWU1_9CHLO|nr:hypothetical protein A3770_15p75570 [Chloropicon primus]UPR04247.1 hypothetical protein HOP50_15g75820 [Chloropicon primus]|eukprot:QDZ25039.1 hypothetical protein A3770_15p75570 [Chloropicon primus]
MIRAVARRVGRFLLVVVLAIVASFLGALHGVIAQGPAPMLEHHSLAHYAAPGPYHMGTMLVDAPKASLFRQSYGYAPVAVYFPTEEAGSGVLARPNTTTGTFQAIGFAHGAGSAAEFYTGLYAHVVSHGFVIVSVRNMAPVPASLGDDMCHGLAWILSESLGQGLHGEESMFYRRVDTDGVGVMGHSMGGGGSLHCAMSWPAKVKAVAPIHPAPGAPASLIYAPMMVAAGALDFVTSPLMVKTAVFDGSPSPKIMPIMNGVAHREPVNYAGASRWNGYLTAFFTLYLRKDLRASMLVWGEEVGSLSRDSRIGVAHRNKGSVIWLESAEAQLRPGEVTSVAGKVTKTCPVTREAHYRLEGFKRIGNGFDVDVGFEIKSTNEYEINFVMHMSAAPARGQQDLGREQKLTVAAINTHDGGSVSFHDIFLTLDGGAGRQGFQAHQTPHPSKTGSFYDNQKPSYESGAAGKVPAVVDPQYQWYLGDGAPLPRNDVAFDDGSWMSLRQGRDSGLGGQEDRLTSSGTRYTAVEETMGYSDESWADVLYSSSKELQKKPEQPTFETLRQGPGLEGNPYENVGGWESQLFPAASSSVPTSLLPWGSIVNPGESPAQGRQSVVLGVADFPGGYGDAREGKPTPKERELMMWINSVRASPKTFEGAYASRGCTLANFRRSEREPQQPLHLSDVLSESAQSHSLSMATDNFVSHIGLDESTPFDRMDEVGYPGGYRGENICAGMKHPFDCVISFMCSEAHRENLMSDTFREMGTGLSSNLASQYTHYWTLNLGHSGLVEQGEFVSSFERGGQHLRTLSVGAHRPEEPIDEVVFASSFFDHLAVPPKSVSVVANGVEFPLELKYGQVHHGLYEQKVQLLSIPMMQVLSGASPCVIYHFKALGGGGRMYRFPELGSYGFGGCDFDDPAAKWMGFQNETTLTLAPGTGPQSLWGRSSSDHGVTRYSVRPPETSDGVCLTDLHLCADGTVARRRPPSCQFFCQSGDPVHVPTDLDFLRSNGQKSFGGVSTCARTGAQFWSGIWNWCPDVLEDAWNDPKNPYRWLIPLWKEIQKVDWVAASNALTEVWQNMQRCKTYKPDSASSNVVQGLTKSSIRIDQDEAVSNMRRVVVRSKVRYEELTSQRLHLSHRYMVGQTVVEKSILLGNATSANGEVIFDDFKEAPMPGWWGSWFETFATTVWNDVKGSLARVQRFAVVDGRDVPIRRPAEALMHFSDKPASSSAGIWELAISHSDPVQSAALGDWDLMVCGEPLSTSLNFTSGGGTCSGDEDLVPHPLCSTSPWGDCRYSGSMHACGSVSTVGGSSTQPPPSSTKSRMGAILKVNEVLHVQPAPGSSMFCSNSPLTQQGWAKPRYEDSGLELGLYLFHNRDPSRESGAWRLVQSDFTAPESGKHYAHTASGRPSSGCWIFYVVSKKGAGPYDFWLASSQ